VEAGPPLLAEPLVDAPAPEPVPVSGVVPPPVLPQAAASASMRNTTEFEWIVRRLAAFICMGTLLMRVFLLVPGSERLILVLMVTP
jgi:hypothetical protein